MFDALDMGASGLLAQRTRLDTIAANIANTNTTHDAARQGQPVPPAVRRLRPGPAERARQARRPRRRRAGDPSPFQRRYEPGHPDADAEGYVSYPNIDLAVEYVNALEASRAYEANVSMMEVTKAMINASLRLIG